MNKVSKVKMLILIVLAVVLISVNTVSYATEIQNVVTITGTDSTQNATADPINVIGNEVENETPIVIENEVPVEDIPEAGREDTVLLALIAIVAISSVYTYAKVKKDNI